MKLPFPASVLAQHIIVLGKTRAGKSSKARLVVEQLLAADEPVCVIDPKGDWWGLKSSADSKQAGYPVVIFGGEHADVPLNPHAGAAVAELVATGNRPSLIDLGGWMVGDRTRFFVDFASTFFKLTRGRRYLVIDEVHNFAPQGRIMDPDAGKMLHWANRLASEGSGKGITIIAASQRPQKVHKDFVTSCETLVACRVIHKLDRDAIKDWIDGCADPAIGRQVLTELAGMKREEAWVWSPEVDFGPARITFPMFSTYDSFKPQLATATAKLKGWAEVDLEEVRGKLQIVVAEAEANDPRALRKRIIDLEAQLAHQVIPDATAPRIAREEGRRNGYREGRIAERRTIVDALSRWQHSLKGQILQAVETGLREVTLPEELGEDPADLDDAPPAEAPHAFPVSTRKLPGNNPVKTPHAAPLNGDRTPVQQRVLDALAELRQMRTQTPDRELVAFMAGYTHLNSKGFANAMGALSSAALIKYPTPGTVELTAEGLRQANPPPRLRSSEELQERVCRMLGGASERILRPLIEAYPQPMPREKLAKAANYEHLNSKGFANAMGRLRSLGFIDYPATGSVVARPVLFLQ